MSINLREETPDLREILRIYISKIIQPLSYLNGRSSRAHHSKSSESNISLSWLGESKSSGGGKNSHHGCN
jgi:hypothetical protein